MALKPNKGRSGNEAERSHAHKWVELYRLAEQAPDGRYCVNPEDDYDKQDFICAGDTEPLLQLLECFAKSGKFVPKDTLGIEGLVLRAMVEEKRKEGTVRGGAVQAVADDRKMDKRKVERLIRRVTDKK